MREQGVLLPFDELAILTGAVEAMVVDVQCIMPALADLVKHFHTLLVTTSPKAKFPGVRHVEFSEERALEVAKEIVRLGIENFRNRGGRAFIPQETMDLVIKALIDFSRLEYVFILKTGERR